MGLLIGQKATDPVVVNVRGGFTTDEAYLNIQNYDKRKDEDKLSLKINLYKSKADKIAGKRPINSTDVGGFFNIECSVAELEADDLFTVAYSKLKTALETVFGVGKIYDDI